MRNNLANVRITKGARMISCGAWARCGGARWRDILMTGLTRRSAGQCERNVNSVRDEVGMLSLLNIG